MAPSDSFARLLARLRRGDNEAVNAVLRRFVRRLEKLARSRLNSQIRQREDPEDVVQSACKSFFIRYRAGKFDGDKYRFLTWDDLWSILAEITVRKCRKRAEYHQAKRRDVRREAHPGLAGDESVGWCESAGEEPLPIEVLIIAEIVEELLRGYDSDGLRIIEWSLQGLTPKEIYEQFGYAERTVRRARAKLRKRLEQMRADGTR